MRTNEELKDLEDLGRAIRRLRQAQHLTIKELAHKAGMSVGHLGVIERGHGNPRLETLFALSDTLNITRYEFMLAVEGEAANGGGT
jgi:transcriptional regulator with XRE-family HTH domain